MTALLLYIFFFKQGTAFFFYILSVLQQNKFDGMDHGTVLAGRKDNAHSGSQ